MKILLQNVTLPLGSGAGSLSYLPMSSNKHLWPLSNRLFCQNCFTLLSYRFIFTAFTIILCSPKTSWRPFPLVLYLPSGASKTLRLIACALCSSFLHAQRSPNDKRSCPSHLPYSKLSRRSFQNRAPCWTKQRKKIPMRSSICQYSNRTWATTNHSTRISTTWSNTQYKHAQRNCRTCERQIYLGAENPWKEMRQEKNDVIRKKPVFFLQFQTGFGQTILFCSS